MLNSNLKIMAEAQSDSTTSSGVLIVTAVAIAIPLLIAVIWLKVDYSRHKRPLKAVDPNVKYTFWHHIKVVTIPLMSYRITFMIQKKNNEL